MSKYSRKTWGTSYSQLVWQQFSSNYVNLVCMWFLIFLFTVAVFAPFIANDKPLVIHIDGK
ncbi:MAG: hypothetical protein ACYC3B_05095, partial [Sedimentisphaerales bacterium]